MPKTNSIAASFTCFQGSSPYFMCRFLDGTGNPAPPSVVSSITRTIVDMDELTTVSQAMLDKSVTLFATLQLDATWTIDETGYNFRDHLPAGSLPNGCRRYRVEYKLAIVDGTSAYVCFDVTTERTFS